MKRGAFAFSFSLVLMATALFARAESLNLGVKNSGSQPAISDTQLLLENPKAATPEIKTPPTIETSASCTDASGQVYKMGQSGFDQCMSRYERERNLPSVKTSNNPVNFTYGSGK